MEGLARPASDDKALENPTTTIDHLATADCAGLDQPLAFGPLNKGRSAKILMRYRCGCCWLLLFLLLLLLMSLLLWWWRREGLVGWLLSLCW
jgi:hypothetical protein